MRGYGIGLVGESKLTKNKDQFGYYTLGDLKTYSKVEAIELHTKSGIHPSWHFNDEIFSKFDWTKEPSESLDQLYAIRAQQIREKYDYIVLFYSGGADSQNMLNSFLRNNIHVDEIANFWAKDGDKDYFTHFNAEIYQVAIPNTLEILKSNSDINHRVIDLTQLIADLYDDPNRKFDFLYDMNSMFSPNNYSRSFLRERIKDYRDIIASGKKLCFVYGSEKPRTFLQDGRYCVKFLDIVDNTVSARTQSLNRDWEYDELFYWSPDLPQLVIKQAHSVMKYLKTVKPNSIDFSKDAKFGSFGCVVLNGSTYYLTNHGLHRIIYGIQNTYTVKPSSTFFSERDAWFLKNPAHLTSSKNYVQGITKLETLLPSYWINGIFSKGIKGCVSKPYWLE